jgi:ATP-dependent Clp protease ATP-binding subunit ClpC
MRNHFSGDLKEAISLSAEEAIRTNSPAIGAAHLLLGLIRHKENRAVTILEQDLGVSLSGLVAAIEETLPRGGEGRSGREEHRDISWHLPLDREAERSIRGSASEAKKAGSRTIGAEYLLLAMIRDKNMLTDIFGRFGIDYQRVSAVLPPPIAPASGHWLFRKRT